MMCSVKSGQSLCLAVLFLSELQSSLAFAPSRSAAIPVSRIGSRRVLPPLWAESEEGGADEKDPVVGAEGEENDEEKVEEPEEDPEVVALKKEIADLESTLKSKKTTLAYCQDQIDEYSKTGYARKVAEMENMRRVRSNLNSSSRSSATAAVLADFLPVYDKMNEIKTTYSGDENKYQGLSMEQTFTKMGVSEYAPEVGALVDDAGISVVESEFSSSAAKGTVIRVVSSGMELDGNVFRQAECVASLGAEDDEDNEASEEDSNEGEGDSEESSP